MKKYLYILAAAAIAFAACSKDEENKNEEGGGGNTDPQPTVKAFEVSPLTISVEADATSASFSVTGEVAWTAASDNRAVAVSPASGSGNGTVVLSFDANSSETPVSATITVATTDKDAATKSFSVAFSQAGKEHEAVFEYDYNTEPDPSKNVEVVASWRFYDVNYVEGEDPVGKNIFDYYDSKFHMEDAKVNKVVNPESNKPGYVSDEHYCPALNGNGKIRFYNGVDKTNLNPGGRCKRGIGTNGDPVWYGNWKGDEIQFSATPAAALEAGKTIYLYCTLQANTTNALRYWIVEAKDGDEWKPAGQVYKAKEGADGPEFEYNVMLKYNEQGDGSAANPYKFNTKVEKEYTLTKPAESIEFRIRCVALVQTGNDYVVTNIGMTGDGTKNENPVVRMAQAKEPAEGKGPAAITNPMVVGYLK